MTELAYAVCAVCGRTILVDRAGLVAGTVHVIWHNPPGSSSRCPGTDKAVTG